jgi:glycosyltransferase involved in cell wall biosynthesis
MINGKKIIAVLPAYKAGKTLKNTLEAIPRDIVDDIILVDDASPDDTVEVSKRLGIKTFVHKKNSGYGSNQKTCYKEALSAGADIVVMVHPDFQYDPKFIPDLVTPIAKGSYDAVFGSRMLIPKNAIKGGMPYWKFLANILLTKIENFILGFDLSEYHSGFRAYSKDLLNTLPVELNSNGFVFDTEIIAQAKIANFKILEKPITTRYFPGASMIGFLRSTEYGLKILFVMIQYLLHKFGVFKFKKFLLIDKDIDITCPNCGSKRSLLIFSQTISIKNILKEKNYSVAETGRETGMFGNIYDCLKCGMFFVDRKETDNVLTDYYKNQPLDKNYLEGERPRRRSFVRVLKQLKKITNNSGGDILDIGCNTGFFLSEAQKFSYGAYGIELSGEAATYAKEKLNLKNVSQGSIEDLGDIFNRKKFDVITMFDVLEHLEEPRPFLKELSKYLKPGGVIIMTIPMIDSPGAAILGKHWHALLPSHINYFTKSSLEDLYSSLGYSFEYKRWYTRFFYASDLIGRILKNQNSKWLSLFRFMVPLNLFDELEIYIRK